MPYPEIVKKNLPISPDSEIDPEEPTEAEIALKLKQDKWVEKNRLKEHWDTQLKEGETEVSNVRKGISDIANTVGGVNEHDPNAWENIFSGNMERPLSKKWLSETSGMFACNSYSSGICKKAGATVPDMIFDEKTDTFVKNPGATINKKLYPPGSRVPFTTGNFNWDDQAQNLGFEQLPQGSQISQEGQLVRRDRFNKNMRERSGFPTFGTRHAQIVSGVTKENQKLDLDNDGLIISGNEGGNVDSGYKLTNKSTTQLGKNDGIQQYVGNLPYLRFQARRHSNVSAISPNMQAELVKHQKVQPVSTNAIIGNTSGINSLFKKMPVRKKKRG
tara:strand:- start:71 stop:1063 length:993 start_codon:yes stop_codon:yes gene_type:complete